MSRAPMRYGLATWVGLALAVSIATLLVLGFVRPRIIGADETTVRVTFRDASALARFDRDVRVAGANVGTVGDVQRDGDRAVVELRFPKGAIGPVHADATAELRPHLLFDGSAYVAFSPGSPGAPLLGDRPLGLSRTRDYVSLERAFRVLDPDTRSALQHGLHDLAATLGRRQRRALRRTFADAPRLFSALRPAMRALQGPGRDELQGTIGGFARTVDALAREQDSLGPLLRGTARTLHAVRVGADRPLDRTISALPAAFSAAASGGRSLEDIVARLEPLAAELRPGARELTPTLRALRPLLVRAREVLSPTPAFVRDLRDTLRSGAAATPATGRMLGLLDPTFEVLRDELLPFLRRDTKAGVPLYEQLSGVATSAGGSMAPVRTRAAAQAANAAPGHGWHYFARILGGATGTPACATVAEPIRAIMRKLGLCVG